jgi:TPR repeat protein
MYQLGNGVQADLEEAEKWYLKAAETRHGKAEFCLATLFRQKGQQTAALHWFEKSASHGYAPGIYALGRIYLVGDGVTADREKAFRYFDEAAEKGHLYARTRIARDTILGRRGISRIPAGALLSIRTFLAVVKQSLRDPESELFSEQ